MIWVTWRYVHFINQFLQYQVHYLTLWILNLKFEISFLIWIFICQTRNLLRIAIFNISYIRGLFPEKYFNDKSVPALGTPVICISFTVYSEYSKTFRWNDSIIMLLWQRWRSKSFCQWMLNLVDWLIGWRKACLSYCLIDCFQSL